MEDREGFLSPPPKLEDVAGFLETDEPWERDECLEGTVPDEGTLPDEGQGFLGITPLKLPAEGLSGCLVSDALEKDGDFFEGRFLVREDVCFSIIDFFDADVCSALSSCFFSSLWAVKTKKKI